MLALISPFQSIIDSLPTSWVQLIDRPQPVTPSTSEAIAFSLLPARMVATALEKFTQPETTEPEPYKPESLPDYWAIAIQSAPETETVTLSPLAISAPDLWAIAPKPVPAKTQLCLPAAREVVVFEIGKPAIATPSPTMLPDGETPNLADFHRVPSVTGYFQVREHGEGHIVKRWKNAKKKGWELSTHLVGDRCDCEQSRKRPTSTCCHQKAVNSHQLAQRNQAITADWERKQDEKSTKFSAEMKAIETQRAKDAEPKLSGLIRTEAQSGKRPQAIGLAKKLDRSALLTECRDLFMDAAFNQSTGMQLLSDRYQKAKTDYLTDEELEDLADYLSANRITLRRQNLRDNHVEKEGLKEGDLCKAKKTGFNYRIKQLNENGFATLQTLVGNFEVTLPIDRLEAI